MFPLCLGNFPLCFRFVFLNKEQGCTLHGKKEWHVPVILHLLLPFWIHSLPWPMYIDLCPRTILLGISCPLASHLFQPIGGTTRRKKVRGITSDFCLSFPIPIHDFDRLCSSVCVHYLWVAHLPQLQLSLGSDSITFYPYPNRCWSSNGYPSFWVLECFTIPFGVS